MTQQVATKQVTFDEAMQNILDVAQLASNETRMVPDEFPIGGAVRQGDVFYVRVEKDFPHGAEVSTCQVVPGDLRGSRHTVEPPTKLFTGTTQPTVVTRDGKKVTLSDSFLGAFVEIQSQRTIAPHPDHAHLSLPPNSHWQVIQQMDMRTKQRMAD